MAPLPKTTLLSQMHDINANRTFLANVIGFFCVSCVIGLANMFTSTLLKVDMNWLVRPLIALVAVYFFVPFLFLKLTPKRK
ncbi:hypothetical protein [Swingsia samuiensis]|uniref:Uncharacterized protein n=1 Tax=Swingsia samuiensis TaxID=1293412 RepID=A0A4Y6UMV3_9PROT|nr:hypothetical protein [Swingsia samuiensis]QDH17726.1 hypothetical protein E3D00_09210 [Swingsia samuiensis]